MSEIFVLNEEKVQLVQRAQLLLGCSTFLLLYLFIEKEKFKVLYRDETLKGLKKDEPLIVSVFEKYEGNS